MFTGLIEAIGTLKQRRSAAGGARVIIECPSLAGSLRLGESVAVDGVCLTAAELLASGFAADVSSETLERTTLGRLAQSSAVNLERALRADGRLGGHFVQGHVDCTGSLKRVAGGGSAGWVFTFSLPPELERYAVERGSVAVNGISLTVAAITGQSFDVAVIAHTYERTTLHRLRAGDPANLEADIIAKYVHRFLSHGEKERDISLQFLHDRGFST